MPSREVCFGDIYLRKDEDRIDHKYGNKFVVIDTYEENGEFAGILRSYYFQRDEVDCVSPFGGLSRSLVDWSSYVGRLTLEEVVQGMANCWGISDPDYIASTTKDLLKLSLKPPLIVHY